MELTEIYPSEPPKHNGFEMESIESSNIEGSVIIVPIVWDTQEFSSVAKTE